MVGVMVYTMQWSRAFIEDGGVIIDRIVYDPNTEDYTDQLSEAEFCMAAYIDEHGSDNVAVLLITFDEAAVIAYNAWDYPTIYDVPWFGCDGTAISQRLIDDAPIQTAHLHIYSTLAAPTESSKYYELQARYDELVHQQLGYYGACTYDISWVLASAILEAQSPNANNVIPLMDRITYNHFGASGWCQLNSAGDRANANYQIWGYDDLGEGTQFVLYGLYDAMTGKVDWY
jgi:branched-chain amino acid transport system substrate-binding protein